MNKKGYEIINIDNIPDKGPALLILYHANSPLDGGLLTAKYLLDKKRKIIAICDKFCYDIPGTFKFS